MRLASASRRPGVSLLEVLGATAVFLIAISGINQLMTIGAETALDVQFRSRATRLCQSKLNEFTAGVEAVDGATNGTFEEDEDWQWQADVASESTAANLYRVTVSVSRQTIRGEIKVSMSQFVFDPKQRGAVPAPATADSSSGSATGTGSTGSGASGTGSTGTGSTGTGTTGGTRPSTGGGTTGTGNTGGTRPSTGGGNSGNTGNTGNTGGGGTRPSGGNTGGRPGG